MNPFRKNREFVGSFKDILKPGRARDTEKSSDSESASISCDSCGSALRLSDLKNNNYVCPVCGKYFSMPAMSRIKELADTNSFHQILHGITADNPLNFPGYSEKLASARRLTGLSEAVICGSLEIDGMKAVIAVMDSRFMMGSMGSAVGEKITRACEYATSKKLPFITVAASGGARMQEGILSLFQMAKTSAAISKHKEAGLPYISVLTNPTTGGVTASFASLGTVTLAEPGALIGFAGPRVIEQTIGEKLPEGFQRSESLYKCGFIDAVVPRDELRESISRLMKMYQPAKKLKPALSEIKMTASLEAPELNPVKFSPYERVKLARAESRPRAKAYIGEIFEDFFPLCGDRCAGEDSSILGGFALYHGLPVMVIAQEKGSDLNEKIAHRFGMPNPEGYRKARRLMNIAENLGLPIISFIDTPGAYPGKEAEERGQGEAIAACLETLSRAEVPVISVFIGEGGSGGALATAVSDYSVMLENSVFSILSPEGFSSILWKDSSRAEEASELMKMTAFDLYELEICDEIAAEYEDLSETAKGLDSSISRGLEPLLKMKGSDIAEKRYRKLRKIGLNPAKGDKK